MIKGLINNKKREILNLNNILYFIFYSIQFKNKLIIIKKIYII